MTSQQQQYDFVGAPTKIWTCDGCTDIISGKCFYGVQKKKKQDDLVITICDACWQQQGQLEIMGTTLDKLCKKIHFVPQFLHVNEVLDECVASLDPALLLNVNLQQVHENVAFWETVVRHFDTLLEDAEHSEEQQFENEQDYEQWQQSTLSLSHFVEKHIVHLVQQAMQKFAKGPNTSKFGKIGVTMHLPEKWNVQVLPSAESNTQTRVFFDCQGMKKCSV